MLIIKEPEISKELAEEIGIHIGDGCSGLYGKNDYQYAITGGVEDEKYFLDFVAPLIKNLFGLDHHFKKSKKDNSITLRYCSKQLVLFKANIGLPVGSKNQISIPKIVLESGFILDCLRGIFDTDGSILFKTKDGKSSFYPVVKLFSKSKVLIEQISSVLENENIGCSTQYNVFVRDKRGFNSTTHGVYVNGKKNLESFMTKIGFSNPKHYSKYLLWKNQGFLKPYSTLENRLKILAEVAQR